MDEYNQGYGMAIRFIANRMKTQAEVRKKLQTRYDLDIIEQIISRLKECKYIDDNNYVSCYVRDRMKFNPMGRLRIKKELVAKGIEKSLIENNHEYNNINEVAAIEDILNKKLSGCDLEDIRDKKRILNYLSRRGFDFNNINKAMGQHSFDI